MDAQAVLAKGSITLIKATGKENLRSDKIAVKEEAKTTVGGIEFTLQDFGTPQWSQKNYPFKLKIAAQTDPSAIESITLLGLDGTELDFEEGGKSTMSFGNVTNVGWTFNLPEQPKEMVISVERYTGQETIVVPFDIEATVGL